MKHILVVDDEKDIAETVAAYCKNAGWAVDLAHDGKTALEYLQTKTYDLAILDLMLPDISGESLCSSVRARAATGIIMLTAKVGPEAAIRGLSIGADDYIEKPFSPGELMARAQALLRRLDPKDRPESAPPGGLSINRSERTVLLDGRPVPLTATEWRLLECLVAYPGRLYSRCELVDRVLDEDFDGIDRTIDAHIKNLRRKIGDEDGSIIETVRGLGYRLGVRL